MFSCFGKSCFETEKDEVEEFKRNNPELVKRMDARKAARKEREKKEIDKIVESAFKDVAEEKKNKDEDAKLEARLINLFQSPPKRTRSLPKGTPPGKGGNKSIKKSIKRKKTSRNKSIKRKNIRRNKSIKRKKTRSKTRSIKY